MQPGGNTDLMIMRTLQLRIFCRLLLRHSGLQICERIMRRRRCLLARAAIPCRFIGNPRMLVFVTVNTKQLPVTAIEWIVVVVVVFVVHCELAQTHTGKLTGASAANMWVEFERTLSVRRFALRAVSARFGNNAVEPGLIGACGFRHVSGLPCRTDSKRNRYAIEVNEWAG